MIGQPDKPFYLVIPPPTREPILQAFGNAHLLITAPDGREVRTETQFLEHRENGQGPLIPPTVLREFTLSQSLRLAAGTSWVHVGLEVFLTVQRYYILPRQPNVADRRGFVGIDLRDPNSQTHAVHSLLRPGGPVVVPRIAMTLCRSDESVG